MRVIKYGWMFCLFLLSFSAMTQNIMTSSPYSMFGVGEIMTGLHGANVSMGGVAIGMRGKMLINTDNPAGLTGLDTCRLFAEASAFAKWESYRSKGDNNQAFTGNFSCFALAGRIMPRWYMAAGVVPYSAVGYYFQSAQELEGSPGSYYTSTFSGDGGLSKIYFSNAFQILPSLSVGVNLSYIFGNMTQTETQGTMSVSQKLFGQSFSPDFGIQYSRRMEREMNLTLGVVYGLPLTIQMEKTKTITENSSEDSYNMKKVSQTLPQYIGGGVSVEYKRMVYAFDYLFRQYSSLISADNRIMFHDSHELRAGVCYFPKAIGSSNIWKRMNYKVGLGLSSPYYMQVREQSGLSWRVSAGLSIPLINGRLHTSVFYDRVDLNSSVLKVGTVGFTFTYTLSELFYKIKL
ncbi:putative uncharacterized protein [Tannerella sp. CAG:118]|nr:putative uncharacterized protein [Tannerella sp. CAG:118]